MTDERTREVAHHPTHAVEVPARGWLACLGLAVRGFCMGSADVVPGVSGGTMAFILGIYEELIESIRTVAQPRFLRPLFRGRIAEAWRVVNGTFLLSVLIGIGAAILTLARTIEWLLENRPVAVWSFFFGLVLASVVTVARRIERWRIGLVIAALLGAAGAWILVGVVPISTPNEWWFLFLSGAIAICAMILPGISGAFVLLLLGKYQYVLSAVNDRDVATILWVAAGAAVGIVSFAQLLGWLFRRYHDVTVAVLTGLMLGSLRKVWPWKRDLDWVITPEGERMVTVQENVLPAVGGELATAVLLALAGLAVVLALEAWANRTSRELRPGS